MWFLTGFKKKQRADAKRESYNPKGYAPIDSVSRQKVVAAFNEKIPNESDLGKVKYQAKTNSGRIYNPIFDQKCGPDPRGRSTR